MAGDEQELVWSLADEIQPPNPITYDFAPVSKAWTKFENWLAAEQYNPAREDTVASQILEASQETARLMAAASPLVEQYMDSRVLAMMNLSEYYCLTEGDLWQTIVSPLAVGLTELEVRHENTDIQQRYTELFDGLDMYSILEYIWIDVEKYGNAFPMEFWEGNELTGIGLLNPKQIVIAPSATVGQRPMWYVPNTDTAREALTMWQNPSSSEWNKHGTQMDLGKVVRLDSGIVTHIPHFKDAHEIYAIPTLIRAARSISTRQMQEEMMRATIEGIKNQIIVWKITEPRKGEVALLQAKLNAARAARTGHMVWSDRLQVQQIIPQAIDSLLAMENWIRLTLDIMRKLGIVTRTLSGEVSNVGQASDFEFDVQLFLSRLQRPRRRVRQWAQYVVNKHAARNGVSPAPTVVMRDIDMQVQSVIKNILTPMMNFGLPSIETILKRAGLPPQAEIAALKRERADGTRDAVSPLAGFAQDTVRRDSEGKEIGRGTTESPQSPGRPSGR